MLCFLVANAESLPSLFTNSSKYKAPQKQNMAPKKSTAAAKATDKQPAAAAAASPSKSAVGKKVGSPLRRSPPKTNTAISGGFTRVAVMVCRLQEGAVLAYIGSTKEGHHPYDAPLCVPVLSGDPAANHLNIAAACQLTHPDSDVVVTGQPSKKDGNRYPIRAFIKLHTSPTENTASNANAWGQSIANFYVKNSKYPTYPIVKVLNATTSIADLPPVNHCVRNEDAAKVAELVYSDAIGDGTFWEHEETVHNFFGDIEHPQSLFHVILDGEGDDDLPEHNIVN